MKDASSERTSRPGETVDAADRPGGPRWVGALRSKSDALGFHRVGIARAGALDEDFPRYEAFVDAGMHGEMSWLGEHRASRRTVDHPGMLDGARSVVVAALAYARDGAGDPSGPDGSVIARYARGGDYHAFFRKRLRQLAAWIRASAPGSRARPMVDTAPMLERAWAQRAGVGFVGKNGCVIVPGIGSFVLLGEVLTTVELPPDEPMTSRCGSCTRCLEACPTEAFAAPYVLDPRKCVSYLTIELRGEVPESLRAGIGERLFGCDTCQDVCPFNRTAEPPLASTARFAVDPRWRALTLADLAQLDEVRFTALTHGSPLARPLRAGLVRNALIVMANRRDRRHLPVLRHVSHTDPDPTVRATATWALVRVAG